MIKIKNQRGITLVSLIITIIVLLILATITIQTGMESIEHSRMVNFVGRMQLLQKKVDFLAQNGGYETLGQELDNEKTLELINRIKEDNILCSSLPDGYQELEYIESTGNQYIDTEINSTRNIEAILLVQSTQTYDRNRIILARSISAGRWFGTAQGYYSCGNGENTFICSEKKRIDINFEKDQITYTIDDNKYARTAVNTDISECTYTLFAPKRQETGVDYNYSTKTKLYSVVLKEDGNIIRHFVPCINENTNEIGLFDIKNNKFYKSITKNSSNESLTNGPEIDFDTRTIRYFNSEAIKNELGIDNIDDDIIVNFSTRHIVSLNGIEYEGKMYYSQYDLPGGQKVKQGTTSTQRELSESITITPKIDGLSATFTITGINLTNGTLLYSRDEKSTWTEIINYTVAGQEITTEKITKSGKYYFKWIDNTNHDNDYELNSEGINLILSNAPKLKGNLGNLSENYDYSNYNETQGSKNWAYATDSETNNIYVWIPRFAYEIENTQNIEFLQEVSNATTTGTYLPETGWKIPEPLKYVTGIWVKVSSVTTDNAGILDNLIDNNLSNLTIL